MKMKIKRSGNPKDWSCPYMEPHTERTYRDQEIYPDGICPWLYYSTYPYMLGLLYGADFRYNEEGDGWACCPAIDGCETFIRKRPKTEEFNDPRIDKKHSFIIYVEVSKVGNCPAGHKVGDRFIFPTCMQNHFACPAGWYNAFPFMDAPQPSCLKDASSVRCPDWKQNVTINI